jgi:hypothetical protein
MEWNQQVAGRNSDCSFLDTKQKRNRLSEEMSKKNKN